MKISKKRIYAFILSLLLAGAIALFCMPLIIKNATLILGFLGGLVFVSLVFIFAFLWNQRNETKLEYKTDVFFWVIISILIALVALVSGYLIIKQNELFNEFSQHQMAQKENQEELKEAERTRGLVFLMSQLFDSIDKELVDNKNRVLSDETIGRIIDLSDALEPDPYSYVAYDSLSVNQLSHERGFLLLTLVRLNLDTSSFKKIKEGSNFAKADLGKAVLMGADLSGAHLMSANFKEANLTDAKLQGSDLRGANFWGATLIKADLESALLNKADLRWVEMDQANLIKVNMQGVNGSFAKMRNANLRGADLRFVTFNDAFFDDAVLEEATLYSSNLVGSNFNKTHLQGADFSRTILYGTDFSEANMTEVSFYQAKVNEGNWLKKLSSWKTIGTHEIQKKYKVIDDPSSRGTYIIEPLK